MAHLTKLIDKAAPVQHLDCCLKAEHGFTMYQLPVLWLQHAVTLAHSGIFAALSPCKVL